MTLQALASAAPAVVRSPRAALLALLALGLLLAAPLAFYDFFLMKVLCFALFAAAYNLLFGYVGLLAFGHAAFFGSGAYVSAHVAKFWDFTPELAVLAGMGVAGLIGLVFGWLAIRRQGLYFAMITLALAQIVYFYAVQAPWTHGEDGIQAVPRGHLFGLIDLTDSYALYCFVLGVFLIGFCILWRAVHSPFGQVLKAIHANEPRAIALGYDVQRFKLLAFALSAAFSGLAGATKAIVFQLASLVDVYFMTSGDVLLMVLIGGIGTIFGPVVGAVVFVTMQHYLADFGSWVLIIQGVIFVLCVLAFRQSIVGTDKAWLARLRRQRRA